MIPIYEQGDGRGIGHSLESFIERFDAICAEHLRTERAASFAFIFYDFKDEYIRQILADQGVFAKLDRLTGRKMSLFYLNASGRKSIRLFNDQFLARLGLEGAALPCLIFFDFRHGEIEDLEMVCIEHGNLVHGFHELYEAVKARIERTPRQQAAGGTTLRWIKSSAKFVTVEVVRAMLRQGLTQIL